METNECEIKKAKIITLMLEGYKTYICAALILISAILFSVKLIDQSTFVLVLGILTGGGLVSSRNATKKLE